MGRSDVRRGHRRWCQPLLPHARLAARPGTRDALRDAPVPGRRGSGRPGQRAAGDLHARGAPGRRLAGGQRLRRRLPATMLLVRRRHEPVGAVLGGSRSAHPPGCRRAGPAAGHRRASTDAPPAAAPVPRRGSATGGLPRRDDGEQSAGGCGRGLGSATGLGSPNAPILAHAIWDLLRDAAPE